MTALRAQYGQFCGPACGAVTVGQVGERYWSFVSSRGEFRCLLARRERNCHAVCTGRAGARVCHEPKWHQFCQKSPFRLYLVVAPPLDSICGLYPPAPPSHRAALPT